MAAVECVSFNNGSDPDCFELVVADKGGTKKDLLVFDPSTAAPSYRSDVAQREPKDYGPEGGGDTWHSR